MKKEHLVIMGSGPAGLSTAYYASQKKMDFALFEAGEAVGGNCRTLQFKDVYFDTGAHRFHDKCKEITAEIMQIMSGELLKINVPSQIFSENIFYDFPLAPYDLIKKFGGNNLVRAALDLCKAKLLNKSKENFENYAVDTYGRYIAEKFLLNYSQKLWGLPAKNLSLSVAGKRLKGLTLKAFLKEGLLGKKVSTAHIDGTFYYPKYGFGSIVKRMESCIDADKINLSSRVTKIIHRHNKIQSIVINDKEEISADIFVNTLPLSLTLKLMDPPIPVEIQELGESVKFRNLRLAVFILSQKKFSNNASLYFPDPEIPFTRIYEPKNRSKELAPVDKTCIVVEIPCQQDDDYWTMSAEELKVKIMNILVLKKLVQAENFIDFTDLKMPYAYPILEADFEVKVTKMLGYLSRFENMHLIGRNAMFEYTHFHDLMKAGKALIYKL